MASPLAGSARCDELRNRPSSDAVVVVIPVHQPVIWRDVVIELPKPPFGLRFTRVRRVRSRLRICVVLVAERAEEPKSIADERTGRLQGNVVELRKVVRPVLVEVWLCISPSERIGLVVVVEVAVEHVAALPC